MNNEALNMKKVLFTAMFAAACTMVGAQTYLDPNAPVEARVKDALSRMTLHEKVQIRFTDIT